MALGFESINLHRLKPAFSLILAGAAEALPSPTVQPRRIGIPPFPMLWLPALVLLLLASPISAAQTTPFAGISLPTTMRLQTDGWWPTKGDRAREEFIGDQECAKCHAVIASSYKDVPMARAAMRPSQAGGWHRRDHLTFNQAPYGYELTTSGDQSILKVTNGTHSLSADLLWAFGLGRMGQTFLYRQLDAFYESRLSYYSSPGVLDITPGHSRTAPETLADALGRQQQPSEIQRCFGCHTTGSTVKGEFRPDDATGGVTCEACHGPGTRHALAMKAGTGNAADTILNPGRLEAVEAVDFCGACHRTWQDVVGSNLTGVGVLNIRFAPYRLENSKCWKRQQDARITCLACHDPHRPLEEDAGSYDSRCLQCHKLRRAAKDNSPHRVGSACPVAPKDCVTCHMPKYEPPNLHATFTDHWIRVVKPGAPYPD